METRRTRSMMAAVVTAGLVLGVTGPAGLASAPPLAAAEASGDVLVFAPTRDDTLSSYGWQFAASMGPVPPATIVIPGNFTDDPGTEVFLYRPGSGPDAIVTGLSEPGGGGERDVLPKRVTGTYIPVPGDFDGDGLTDIIWYGPGAVSDTMWIFREDGSHTNPPLSINGRRYRPVVIDADGDGGDDVLWYAPGTTADITWLFSDGGGHFRQQPLQIDGDYTPVVGRFGNRPEGSPQERLIFWSAAGRSPIWTFDTSGGHTSATVPVGGGRPVVGDFTGNGLDAVLAYRPGPGVEGFLSFDPEGGASYDPAPQVNGTYEPVVLDFDGNGRQDIAWTTDGRATIWRFGAGGSYAQTSINAHQPGAIATAAYPDPADL